MAKFLFEIFMEEIPHGVLPTTLKYFQERLPQLLIDYGLSYQNINFFITPRRIAFIISELPIKGLDRVIEQKGPSLKAAYDNDGKPTRALQGFLDSTQSQLSDIEERDIKGQSYIFIQKTQSGDLLTAILPNILNDLVTGIKFPQPMRWNHSGSVYEFIRPVRGITAMIDDQILPVEFFGITSQNNIHAHRQIAPNTLFLDHVDNYEKSLKQNGCIPSFKERQDIIAQQIQECVKTINGKALLDDELLSILASLTEYPHPLLAKFDEQFLSLPKEVLISEMKVHQKYVPIVDNNENLLPYYIITANIPYQDPQTKQNILAGNDRVLRARFADGQFFFEEDMKKGLDFYAQQLSSVAFIDGAGAIADKVTRMKQIANYLRGKLTPHIDQNLLDQAVSLAKADLNSLMVGEFPELQGIIAYHYATKQGVNPQVALALKEHYYPMNLDGESLNPTQELSALVGLADRIDNLLTLYAVGKSVTGSRDPYALRRQTIALIHILIQYNWTSFSLSTLFENITNLYTPFLTIDQQLWKTSINEFIKTRLEGVLKSEPYHYDVDILNAVLDGDIDFIISDIMRAQALQTIRLQHQKPLAHLVDLYKRISNILKDQKIQTFQESLLSEDAEKELYKAYIEIANRSTELSDLENFLQLINLEPIIGNFFENIMVKTGDDKEFNRIALLSSIQQLFKHQADFSKLSL